MGTNSLTLTHRQDIFALEFAAVSNSASQNNRYRYRLEGLEAQWNEVGSRQRLAAYTSLPRGKYVFRVQGSNNDQVWNETESALAIAVLPPWWATSWLLTSLDCLRRSQVRTLAFPRERITARRPRPDGQVTERTAELLKRTRELEIAKEAAEAASRAKTSFLANMSHELRTPLNAILGFSNLLMSANVTVRQRSDLGVITKAGEHLLKLIDEVLDLARIEAGRGVLEIGPCELTGLFHEVIGMMCGPAEAKHLKLSLLTSTGIPDHVLADSHKLRQVLINLLGNAIKYTAQGSVTLRVEVLRTDTDGRCLLKLFVEDTGAGIADEDRERIFEAFVQIGKPEAYKGSGLGLAITRQFVELMGGVIQVESTLGKGSIFSVELPVELTEQGAPPGRDREQIIGLEPGDTEYRILIADDEKENRTVLQRFLENAGFHVRLAEDGAQALEMFRSWRPHFIWMDLRMPVMDGIQASRQIRELDGGQQVKIAAVTASAFASQRTEVLMAGLDDFVCKPYRPDDIFRCMASHLGVRYRYAEAAPLTPAEPVALQAEAFTTLSGALRAELRDAIVSLHRERIVGSIGRVSERDFKLGSALTHCVDRFAYSEIFRAIKGCPTESTNSGHHLQEPNQPSAEQPLG